MGFHGARNIGKPVRALARGSDCRFRLNSSRFRACRGRLVTDIHFSHRGSDCSCKRVRGEQVNSNERGHALSMGVRRFSRTDGGRGLTIWRGLPGAWHRGRAGPALRQHRGDERPPGRDRPQCRTVRRGNDPPDHVLTLRTPRGPHPRRCRMAWLKCPRRARQPLPADPAALQPGTLRR